MGIYGIKPKFQNVLRTVECPLVRWRVHPDVLTLSALGISFLGGFALFASRWTVWTLLAIPFVVFIRISLNAPHGLEHTLEFPVGWLLLLGGVVILFRRCPQISLRCDEPSFNSQEGG